MNVLEFWHRNGADCGSCPRLQLDATRRNPIRWSWLCLPQVLYCQSALSSQPLRVSSGSSSVRHMTETPKSLSEHTSKSPSFDLDDAFSDGESDNGRYAFDPATIREELAKGIAENREAESRSGAKTPEDSISTLDIGHAVTLPEESQPSSPTDDFETASRFSEISLTTSNSQSSSNEQEVQITIEEPEDDESNASDAAHPPASNDGSKPSGHRVTLSIESNTTTIPQSQPNTPSSSSIALPPSPHTPVSALVDAASIALPPSLPSTPSAHTHQISSAPEPQGLTEPPQESRHRRAKSTGPSTFEKYMSKTRPIYLPPKSKQEDNKHMADWEAMMKQSRQAGPLTNFRGELLTHA